MSQPAGEAPAMDTSADAGRIVFKRCLCGSPTVHGYFYFEQDGRRIDLEEGAYKDKNSAFERLDEYLNDKMVTVEDKARIEVEIQQVFVGAITDPVNTPKGVFSEDLGGIQELLDMIMGRRVTQQPSEKDGRFSFRMCTECDDPEPHGYFYTPDGSIIVINRELRCKRDCLEVLNAAVKAKRLTEAEAERVIQDVDDSELPKKKPYRGPFSFKIINERGVLEGAFVPKDYGPLVGVEPIVTKVSAKELLNNGIELEQILESEREKLLAEINSSGLPEE